MCSSSTPIIKAEKRKKEIREGGGEGEPKKKNSLFFFTFFFLGRLWIVRDNPIDSGITVAFPGSILHTQMRWEMRGKKGGCCMKQPCIFEFFLFILISKGLLCSMFVVGAPFDTNPSLSFRGSRGEENRRDIFPLMWLVNYSTYYILSHSGLFCWLMIHFLWDRNWEVIGSFMIKQKKNSVAWRFLLQNLWVIVIKIMF